MEQITCQQANGSRDPDVRSGLKLERLLYSFRIREGKFREIWTAIHHTQSDYIKRLEKVLDAFN
jgi:hypothetical protein